MDVGRERPDLRGALVGLLADDDVVRGDPDEPLDGVDLAEHEDRVELEGVRDPRGRDEAGVEDELGEQRGAGPARGD